MTDSTITSANYPLESNVEATRQESRVTGIDWVQKYLFAHFSADTKNVLELGCGAGMLSSAVAASYPACSVIGTDLSDDRIEYAKCKYEEQANLTYKKENALKLSFADNSFDVVYSRFLHEHLPESEICVQEMFRVCRPGGIVLIQDIDYMMAGYYPDNNFPAEFNQVFTALKSHKVFDANIGRALYTHMHRTGLTGIKVQIEGYDVFAGTPSQEEIDHFSHQFAMYRDILAMILGAKSKADQFLSEMSNYITNPETLNFSLLFTVAGKKG